MKKQEAIALMAYISQLDRREVTPETINAWYDVLDADMPVGAAREAVRRFYGKVSGDDRVRYIMPGDINVFWRKHKDSMKPSEAQIERECLSIGVEDMWSYRRARMLGASPEEAVKGVKLIEGKESKSAPVRRGLSSGLSLAGDVDINDVLK